MAIIFNSVLSPEQHWVCAADRDNAGEVPNAHSGGHWGPRLPHRYLDVVLLSVLLLWTCLLISTVVFIFIEFILYFRIITWSFFFIPFSDLFYFPNLHPLLFCSAVFSDYKFTSCHHTINSKIFPTSWLLFLLVCWVMVLERSCTKYPLVLYGIITDKDLFEWNRHDIYIYWLLTSVYPDATINQQSI